MSGVSAGLAGGIEVELVAVFAADVGAVPASADEAGCYCYGVADGVGVGDAVAPVVPVAGDAVGQLGWGAVLQLGGEGSQDALGAVFGDVAG
ncbi:hypothetical protein [Actinomadura bangladeshensis]|uniref:Uncharacterized protein n=1 Tax=Actinomadura bangladeshensis TaxID=453573 RepID=A0A6L9QR74_9ACTN|nr:hypothetical protein [Actinomadura bangladeshensis]NEA27997.1 hypothetical protein [Actinomadura bangladeshensis]